MLQRFDYDETFASRQLVKMRACRQRRRWDHAEVVIVPNKARAGRQSGSAWSIWSAKQ